MLLHRTKPGRLKARRSHKDPFQVDVIAGLSAQPKHLPCKYFYDQRGSALFDAICNLDEYYLTRSELEIMERFAPEMARAVGPAATIVEFGSGSSVKTQLLLDQLGACVYIPVDISREHLQATAHALTRLYPHVAVRPVSADFTTDFELPAVEGRRTSRTVYFPGSTIGNFEREEATSLLNRIAALCGPTGGLLIGIDLQKDVQTIEAAYNDAQGVTAQFNLNLLARINRELGGQFELTQFEHSAVYDHDYHRVDIRLVSRCNQSVEIGADVFNFRCGESIQTEYSHKYSLDGFAGMAGEVGLRLQKCWTDRRGYFAVLYMTW